jgi:drug/metabolite transporter (DMT)-like permease
MLCVGTGGVAWGITKIDTGTAALIVASVPLWLTLLDRVANGARLAPAALVGLAVGFAGVGLLVGPGAEGSAIAGLVLVFTSLAWAVGSLAARRLPGHAPPLAGAAMQMIGGGAVCAVVGVAGGELSRVETPSAASLVALVYLVAFGSLVGYTAYVWLLANASMSVVGTYAYVNPIVAVLLGSLFLDERLGWMTIAAGTAVLAAVALIVSARRVEARPTRFAAALPVRGK